MDNISILGVIAMNMEKVKQEGITFYFMVMAYSKRKRKKRKLEDQRETSPLKL